MNQTSSNRFGTFGGVFTPSILTILGAILFMRSGFVIGEAGIVNAILILLLAKAISLLTALSVSAIATNMQVRGGGAYFLISRVLGPESGGAIGIVFFIAQALSVPFYILGFTESMVVTLPALEPYFLYIAIATAALLFTIAYISAGWAIRAQYVIMAVLALSIVAFFGGALLRFSPEQFAANLGSAYTLVPGGGALRYSFWSVFAIYFPAVTGLLAGVNMSGDLKDASRSIPRGTFAAIGVGFAVYLAQIILHGGAYPRADLIENPYGIMVANALLSLGFLVAAGVWAATLSSGLGSYLGAPRILQAVARDRLLPMLKPFATGSRIGDEPRPALLLTGIITLLTLAWAGGVSGGQAFNVVASVITMFFLYTYGMLNLAAFTEAYGRNPSFRPRFKLFHWSTALLGALGCGAVALLIDPLPAVIAILVIGALYWHLQRRQLSTTFGDALRGFLFSRVRRGLLGLRNLAEDGKNWRPTILAFSGNPRTRETLVNFAVWLEAGRGLVLLVNIIRGDPATTTQQHLLARRQLEGFLEKNNIQAFPCTVVAQDIAHGIALTLQSASIGSIRPNMALFGWNSHPADLPSFLNYLKIAQQVGMSVVLIHLPDTPAARKTKRIDVWWRGRKNGALMLLLAHLLGLNWEWSNARIRLLRLIENDAGRVPALEALSDLVKKARLDADAKVIVSERRFAEVLHEHSADADCVFLGMEFPEDEQAGPWHAWHEAVFAAMPTVILVNSTGTEDLLV